MPLQTEKTAQELFYEQFNLPLEAMQYNCDGYYNGCILEFKKSNHTTINSALFQSIKYLSSFRVRGIPVPALILLVFPNDTKVYVFKSEHYLRQIETLYNDSASRNTGRKVLKASADYKTIDYSKPKGIEILNKLFHQQKPQWTKIHIDEHCVVGWAQRFYHIKPKAKKEDFLHESDDLFETYGELREPVVLVKYIYPYLETGNQKFKYILDKLNDKLTQKELGAFYTPPLYAQKALELVRDAIKEVPEGNDYVIIDRCAGSGNLEEAMSDEELSHCILNTYEYFEYLVLRENFGDKVREIIPPTTDDDYEAVGKVKGSDALNWRGGVHEVIKQYLNNPQCTVILFENPPYRDVTSNTSGVAKKNIGSFVRSACTLKGAEKNEVCNLFIWSAFAYYLRQPSDAYIVFAPIKYNKSIGLGGRFVRGYLFNRKHFHANPAAISCISWRKAERVDTEFNLDCFDIEDSQLKPQDSVSVKHCSKTLSTYFDKRRTDDYIAFATISGFLIGHVNIGFYRSELQLKGHGSPCCIYADNYIEKLPMLAAKCFPQSRWQEREFVFTTSDRGDTYTQDTSFLHCCFIWSCLSQKNHCLSFETDGRLYNQLYRNELCFDKGTIASAELKKHHLNKDEEQLLKWWRLLLRKVKRTKEYNPQFTYGLYQIEKEINIQNEDKEYVHPDIHNDIQALKLLLKAYYAKYIVKKLFEYELLK
ncbi:hypothetical protein FACS1894170_08670 [Planctomycetales bacterium]|nr:hypothetical protein FACS1894170_08670 [Planctomycetales bacterium]